MKVKLINKKVITAGVILGIILMFGIIFTYNKLHDSQLDYVYMHASWTYRYADVADLTNNSDCIARVKVKDNGTSSVNSGIPETIFTVEVTKAISNCEKGDLLNIYMTGGKKDNHIFEMSDDPLMKKEDQYIIFAKSNADGTFTVLGGSQGRMQYKDGKVSSLNMVNEQVKKNSGALIKMDDITEDTLIGEIQDNLVKK
jgi:hypothetical protein